MRRSHGWTANGPYGRLVRMTDLLLMGAVLVAALAITTRSFELPRLAYILAIRIKVANLFLLFGYLALCSGVFTVSNFYRSHRLSTFQQRLHEVLLASSLITLALLALRWPFKLDFASNQFLLVYWALALVVLGVTREGAQRLLYFLRSHGRNVRNVVIVAEGTDGEALAQYVQEAPGLGYRVVATVDATQEIDEDERYASAV